MSRKSTLRPTKNVISMDEVLARTALSKSKLYKLLRQDRFPHPAPMSNRSIGWFEADIEDWLQASQTARQKHPALPVVYMAGRMGEPADGRIPGSDWSCRPIFDVSLSLALGNPAIQSPGADALIAPPQEMVFHETRTRFMYSGPWKAQGIHGRFMHGVTSCSSDKDQDAAYRAALQGISRADVLVAYLEDLETHDTLVEIGFARATNKRVVLITSPALHKTPLDGGLWFAVRAADRHIQLPDRPGCTSKDLWRLAHAHAAMTISEWYPHSMASPSERLLLHRFL